MRVSAPKYAPRTFIAITSSSSAQLPARSPMPLMVHSTWRAPPSIAASELATAMPRSSWQCALNTTSLAPGTVAIRRWNRPRISAGVV